MPVKYSWPDTPGDADEVIKEPARDPAGIFHPDHDLGQDIFEDPRRREEIGGPEFAQIGDHGRLRFRAGGAKAGAIGLRIREDVLADPRHRQIGEHLLAVGQALELDRVLRGSYDVVKTQDDPFRPPGRARGVKDDRGITAPPFIDLVTEEAGLAAGEFAAALLNRRIIIKE